MSGLAFESCLRGVENHHKRRGREKKKVAGVDRGEGLTTATA